ncbi:MAG TPA: EsaB/YukD family protein [Ktedonobacteraceae bacterium]
MQQTLLLTLQGPRRRLDIELPGDVPVSDLLPLLRQICGDAAGGDRWSLSRQTGGRPLQAAHTLLDNKVLDGEVLVLHKEGTPLEARSAKRQAAPALQTQGGSIRITWEK